MSLRCANGLFSSGGFAPFVRLEPDGGRYGPGRPGWPAEPAPAEKDRVDIATAC